MSKLCSKSVVSSLATVVVTLGLGSAIAAEPNREQGAHQHGHGRFNMAIEKGTVSIELEAPGSDIVGFEHPPKTAAEKKAVEAAKAQLKDALKLFGLPKDAGCRVTKTDIDVHGAGDDHKHDHGAHDRGAKDAKAPPAKADETPPAHTEFHAQYTLTCSKPSAITGLDFAFFAAFPGAQELEVVAISDKGQVKAEATRKAPKVSLPGLW